ncbi:MAG: hypothetical protein AAF533_27890 [Acidobacteriota bacterium]
MTTRSWQLLSGHAGRLDDPTDPACVVGLLVEDGLSQADELRVRRLLRQLVPSVPWALLGRVLARPELLAVAGAMNEDEDGRDDEDDEPLAALLGTCEPTTFERVREDLTVGREPEPEDGRRLADVLVQAPVLRRSLRDRQRRRRQDVHALLADLHRARPDAVACFVTGEGEPGESDTSGEERFLELLESQLQRVADVLERRDGTHELRLAAVRWVVDDGRGHPTPLELAQQAALAHALVAHRRVSLAPWSNPRQGAEQRPLLVAAEVLAQRARRQLEAESLTAVEAGLAPCWPVRSGAPAASHVSATGETARCLTGLRQGEPAVLPTGPSTRRWAREQAEEWRRAWESAP